MVFWPAVMETASNAVYSVMVKRIVLMVPMKTVVVSNLSTFFQYKFYFHIFEALDE